MTLLAGHAMTRTLAQLWLAAAGVVAFACLAAAAPDAGDSRDTAPSRVVSMNLCTDQLAMLVAAPGQLISVSNLASDTTLSSMADAARGFEANTGAAEDIFLLRPDLIIAGRYTTRDTVALLRRLGFRVVVFDLATSFADIRANITAMGQLLGRETTAAELVAAFDTRLATLMSRQPTPTPPTTAVLHHANSYTSGEATLGNAILAAAGVTNLGHTLSARGLTRLPLELLVMGAPDIVLTDRAWTATPAQAQQTFQHPALRALAADGGVIASTDTAWTCGTPHVLDAIADVKKLVARVAANRLARDKSKLAAFSATPAAVGTLRRAAP